LNKCVFGQLDECDGATPSQLPMTARCVINQAPFHPAKGGKVRLLSVMFIQRLDNQTDKNAETDQHGQNDCTGKDFHCMHLS
jgi:hypothetical protein